MKNDFRDKLILKGLLILSLVGMVSCGKKNDPPFMRLSGADSITIGRGESFVDPGAIAFDREDYDLTTSIVTEGHVDNSRVGYYNIFYECSDADGNTTKLTRVVHVKHTIASFAGRYTSSTDFNICQRAGTATAGYDPNYMDQINLVPALGYVMNSSSVLASFADDRNTSFVVDGGRVPCGYRITQGTGTFTDDGDSILFTVHVVNELNASSFFDISLQYIRE